MAPPDSSDPPIGKTWPAQKYEVGREKIREYASAIGSGALIHFEPAAARKAGFDAVVAPPTFAAVYVARPLAGALFDPEVGVFDPQAGLAGYRFVQRGQRWEWGVPVQSGDVITTEASLAGGEERDGAIYRTFASTSHNQRGELVLRGTYQGVVPAPKPRTSGGPGTENTETGAFRRGTAPKRTQREVGDDREAWGGEWPPVPGAALPGLTFTPDKYAPVRYAGASGDFTPFHLDPALARSVGLDGVILHGLYTFAQLARGVLAPLNDDPRALRSLAAHFRRPAFPERELTVAGRFAEAGPGGSAAAAATSPAARPEATAATEPSAGDGKVARDDSRTAGRDETAGSVAILECAVLQGGKQVLSGGVAELVPLPPAK